MSRNSKKPAKKRENPLKPKRDFKSYITFLLVAAILLFVVDYFVFGSERPYITKFKADYYAQKALEEKKRQEAIEALLPPKVVYPENGAEYFEAPDEEGEPLKPEDEQLLMFNDLLEEQEVDAPKLATIIEPKAVTPPLPKYNKPVFTGERAKIAIVIDDVGMNISQSRAAIDLPSEVTLAFLPYAERVREMSQQARAQGHELIIHTPMEAMASTVSLGSMALRSNMDFATFDAEFNKIADSFEGYVGVNNHMGSRLTQDAEAMGFLMDQLKKRGLYFLDSRTIATSIAADTAHDYGIPYAVRDVFLDHEETPEYTARAIQKIERIAREQGGAIAIGHPKEITMKALRNWIPTLEARGFELVHLSELLSQPKTIMVENKTPHNFNDIQPASGAPLDITPADIIDPALEHAYDNWRINN